MTKLSVIIPAYNEKKYIISLLKKVDAVNLGEIEKEIIVINDGSKDNTKELVEEYIKDSGSKDILLINKENGGKGSALKLGFRKATGDILIIQDADLEYEPEDYHELIKPIVNKKVKVVYGSRFKKKNAKSYWSYYLGNIGINVAFNLIFQTWMTDMYTCYKVFHRNLIPILLSGEGNGFDWEPEITGKIIRKGYRIKEVPISYYPRSKEEGKKIRPMDGVIAIKTMLKWRFKKLKI